MSAMTLKGGFKLLSLTYRKSFGKVCTRLNQRESNYHDNGSKLDFKEICYDHIL